MVQGPPEPRRGKPEYPRWARQNALAQYSHAASKGIVRLGGRETDSFECASWGMEKKCSQVIFFKIPSHLIHVFPYIMRWILSSNSAAIEMFEILSMWFSQPLEVVVENLGFLSDEGVFHSGTLNYPQKIFGMRWDSRENCLDLKGLWLPEI